MTRNYLIAMLALLLVLEGCADARNIRPAGKLIDPNTLQSGQTLAAVPDGPGLWPRDDWWRSFGDPQLDTLIDEAIANSPSLETAQARIAQARAASLLAGSALGPDVSAALKSSRQRLSEHGFFPAPFAGSKFTQTDLSLDLTYELDFWGRNRDLFRAAIDAQRAAEVEAYASRLLLAAGILKSYLQLDRAYALREVTQATLQQRQHLLDLTRMRVNAGIETQVELRQSSAAVPQTRGELIRLDEQIRLLENQLAALAGQGPDRGLVLTRPKLDFLQGVPLPTVIPADLLGRRPNVVAQRWRIESLGKEVKAARADFYPNINLTATVGFEALSLGKLLEGGSHTYAAGPAVRLPIFNAGRLRGRLQARAAEYDLAVADYNSAVVDAMREVADQLAILSAIDGERIAADQSLGALQGAFDLALLRYQSGLTNYLNVLIAEGQVLELRRLKVDIETRRLDASVSLIRALGGGFVPDSAPSAS
jgi:NodT family efflux transporter outer membrane factor (OMF) lipoprotein